MHNAQAQLHKNVCINIIMKCPQAWCIGGYHQYHAEKKKTEFKSQVHVLEHTYLPEYPMLVSSSFSSSSKQYSGWVKQILLLSTVLYPLWF